jgi:hypothetical protein
MSVNPTVDDLTIAQDECVTVCVCKALRMIHGVTQEIGRFSLHRRLRSVSHYLVPNALLITAAYSDTGVRLPSNIRRRGHICLDSGARRQPWCSVVSLCPLLVDGSQHCNAGDDTYKVSTRGASLTLTKPCLSHQRLPPFRCI